VAFLTDQFLIGADWRTERLEAELSEYVTECPAWEADNRSNSQFPVFIKPEGPNNYITIITVTLIIIFVTAASY
jgi:hypothetical protein